MEGKKVFIIGGTILALLIILLVAVFMFKGKDEQVDPNAQNTPSQSQGQDKGQNIAGIQPTDTNNTKDPEDEEPTYEVVFPEEPPVITLYNEEADKNADNFIDKSEWEEWVAAHPEDLNQDLFISDEELEAYEKQDQEAIESMQPVTPEELQQQAADQQQQVENQQQGAINTPMPSTTPEQNENNNSNYGGLTQEEYEWVIQQGGDPNAKSDFSSHPGAYRDPVTGNWTVPDTAVK